MMTVSSSLPKGVVLSCCILVISYILHYFYIDNSIAYEEKSLLDLLTSKALSDPIKKIVLRTRLTKDEDLAYLMAKIVSGGVYAMVTLSTLGTLGIDTSPLVAGIGITGFTIGFALKEIATNFLSGMLLVLDKPFQKGQYLKVLSTTANMEGTVESIDARYVRLRTKDKCTVMVPSAIVYSSAILVGPVEPTGVVGLVEATTTPTGRSSESSTCSSNSGNNSKQS